MADPVTQDAGGGEGHTPGQPSVPAQDSKPVDPVKTELVAEIKAEVPETKPEVVSEVKSAESPVPNPAEAVANAPDTEVKANDEVKVAEAKPEVADAAAEIETEIKADAPAAEVKSELLEAKQNNLSDGDAGGANNWQQRELALLKKIEELEKVKNESSQNSTKMELKIREEEIDLLKARVRNLETELQAALSKPGPKNHEMIENIKQQHEELLSKARGMIFDKTKMVKNQELQIEALTTQVQSLKDINLITKDLLEIRNSEIKAMEDRLQAMEARFSKEKERYGLVLQRAQTSTNINDDLKKEYETQLKIFKELRTKYEQKVEALVAENNKLKLELVRAGGSVPSTEAPK